MQGSKVRKIHLVGATLALADLVSSGCSSERPLVPVPRLPPCSNHFGPPRVCPPALSTLSPASLGQMERKPALSGTPVQKSRLRRRQINNSGSRRAQNLPPPRPPPPVALWGVSGSTPNPLGMGTHGTPLAPWAPLCGILSCVYRSCLL